jgi:demethylmenaquinone methyltransferase/2-methoxy-6-polyprenyl-1,4-benzoquinol methylase
MESADWNRLMDTLESLIPYYERLNHCVTFFMLWKWRNIAAKLTNQEDEVLEIGSGPGNFSKMLDAKQICCLDPSEKMLVWSKQVLNGGKYNSVQGIGEQLPLRNERFDKVYCLFSFRDFMDRNKGAQEVIRVLKKGGSFIVLDILKPKSLSKKKLVDFWIRHGTSLMVKLLVPKSKDIWSKNPYELFYRTYEAFETEASLKALVETSGFEDVKTKYLGFGAFMLVARKGDGA